MTTLAVIVFIPLCIAAGSLLMWKSALDAADLIAAENGTLRSANTSVVLENQRLMDTIDTGDEACALIAEIYGAVEAGPEDVYEQGFHDCAVGIARAIRARGNRP